MIEIQVTVVIPGMTDALNNLADAIAGRAKTAPKLPENTRPGTGENRPDEAEKPAAETPKQPEEEFSLNAISLAGAKLVDAGKTAQVVEALRRFNATAITQLKKEQYADFAHALRDLGAEI